jgi:hypothetical protein
MRRPGRLDLRLLPPTARQRTLLIAQAEERVERSAQRNRYEGRPCPGCGARFLADRGQKYCTASCAQRGNANARRPAEPIPPAPRASDGSHREDGS